MGLNSLPSKTYPILSYLPKISIVYNKNNNASLLSTSLRARVSPCVFCPKVYHLGTVEAWVALLRYCNESLNCLDELPLCFIV